jgi:hypothetical protein
LGTVLKRTEAAHILRRFFHGKRTALILTMNGLGYILGDFFSNSSGRPGQEDAAKKQHC